MNNQILCNHSHSFLSLPSITRILIIPRYEAFPHDGEKLIHNARSQHYAPHSRHPAIIHETELFHKRIVLFHFATDKLNELLAFRGKCIHMMYHFKILAIY